METVTAVSEMQENHEWFKENYDALIPKYAGRYLIINNKEVKADFGDFLEALSFGVTKFGYGHFNLSKCLADKSNLVIYMY